MALNPSPPHLPGHGRSLTPQLMDLANLACLLWGSPASGSQALRPQMDHHAHLDFYVGPGDSNSGTGALAFQASVLSTVVSPAPALAFLK